MLTGIGQIELIQRGTLSLEEFSLAIKNLRILEGSGVTGARIFINKFKTSGGRNYVGAEWQLRYLHQNNLLTSVTGFENATLSPGRIIDVLVDGKRYEFKSWKDWFFPYGTPPTPSHGAFMREFLNDLNSANLNEIIWIFERRDGLINRSTLRTKIEEAMILFKNDINDPSKLATSIRNDIFDTTGNVGASHIKAFLDNFFEQLFKNTSITPL